ncbi:hypothetical protein ZWY2020_009518 [Hordeum vulgare]|nr:hypothetical protein ZWY2020_009518 [Hordeum vulgare]
MEVFNAILLLFSTMQCYCFVCDAPAPCNNWDKGLSNDDHCHATDKETKWKTLRKLLKLNNLSASHSERHSNALYPTTSSLGRQQECTSEEHTSEDDGEYFEPDEEATVYVGNLPYYTDSEYLAQLFKYAGTIESSEIIYNKETRQSRGFGFITMSTVEQAEKAVEIFHACVSRTARVEERRSPRRSGSSTSVKIYVGHLPYEVDDSRLRRLFSRYGDVVDVEVIYDYGGAGWRSRGFGFVTMATREEADDAIWDLDKQVWRGRELRVEVAKEEMRGWTAGLGSRFRHAGHLLPFF